MKLLHGAIATVLFVLSSPLWAAPKSVTLAVPGMTCPTCPVTIKKALMKEQGALRVSRFVMRRKNLLCLSTMRRQHRMPS